MTFDIQVSESETTSMPQVFSLKERIFRLLNSNLKFSDIIVHEDKPLHLLQPKRLVTVDGSVDDELRNDLSVSQYTKVDGDVSRHDIEDFFATMAEDWRERINQGSFDVGRDVEKFRVRLNCFTYRGGKFLGAVIRKFPASPLKIHELGLHPNGIEMANFTSGLILVIGDTCQGKTNTVASILDHINATRHGHIVTIEDPIELIIPDRGCIVTQREIGKPPHGDVESFYDATHDALRQRPSVIAFGEIRDDPLIAKEVMAIAEAGPLVIATLHAKYTELGIQKFLNLLGDEKNTAVTLAKTLRGVITQVLVPSVTGEDYHLASECVTLSSASSIVTAISNRNWGDIRGLISSASCGVNSKVNTLNGELVRLIGEGKISVQDAYLKTNHEKELRDLLPGKP